MGASSAPASCTTSRRPAGRTSILLERRELTAGSTWHAAGGMHTLNGDPNVARLQQYTIQLYEEIERVSGQDCSIHLPGGLMLADTEVRMDFLRMAVSARPLPRDGARAHHGEGGRRTSSRSSTRSTSSVRCTTRSRATSTRPASPAPTSSAPSSPAPRSASTRRWSALSQRPDGTWDVRSRTATRSTPSTSSTPAACGRARSAGSSGSSCRSSRWSTLPADRRHARGRRVQRADRPRDADGARLRGRDLHPPGRRGDAPRDVRAGCRAVVAARDAVGLRVAAPQAGPRPDHAGAQRRVQALPGDGHDRHPAGRQRAVHVRARRQSARRAGPRPARLLGRLRGDGRAVSRAAASGSRSRRG